MQPEQLKTLQYCQSKYQTILPNQDVKFTLVQSHQIIQLFSQYEILVQLLIQNALFCKSETLRQKTMQMLEQLEKQDHAQLYSIDLSQFNDNPLTIEVSPLQSSFQLPLLKQSKTILENINKNFDDKIVVLKKYTPLIQSSYLPQQYQISKVRCKFTPVDEDLLFQGLQKHGSKKLEEIQKEFLWEKTLKQIKNKYKNSICSNAQLNKIKTWKLSQYEYLNQKELQQFIKGIQWFGKDKCQLIHKFFVTTRSSDFLNKQQKLLLYSELNKADQLLKKRKKHNISESYPSHYEQLWNEERKKIQLKVNFEITQSIQKEELPTFDKYFNLSYEYSNSICKSNFEFSRLGGYSLFSNQQQQANQISQQQQQKVQTPFEVWKNAISSLPELKG
ncbi:unnamed protein product (macronuclear) [Paramecium tetraurelia]|uniref:Myb-like domain-containing protein n=1 Tax=Paramecium tetraurelia TaxID=5888 RepID=A0DCF1_PARTE|nr:uncharacterized protein GSPATT00015596001 [Paramecium tetraurelia]CAK80718.1 unnamed protein product [Paramecium tetraurelia]|eukprot:XP_001448115.1 hypothetical protein (macronuclear) [Paramecium tetraurelia strain d4-2]